MTNDESVVKQPSIWKEALNELKSTKTLALAAVFVALKIAISAIYFTVPAVSNTRVYFHFLVTSLGGVIYGPVVGFWAGFVGDTAGYLINPTGAYFPGYCITAMVTGLIYGVFFYRRKITVVRIVICRLAVSVVCNIVLNGMWSSILMGGHLLEVIIARTPKNLIMLPIEVVMTYITFRAMLPVLKSRNILSYELLTDKIPLI